MEISLNVQFEQMAQKLLSEASKYCAARCSEDIRHWEKFVQDFIGQPPAFDILLELLNQPHLFSSGAMQLLTVTSVAKLFCVSLSHQPVSQLQLTLLCQRQQQYASIAVSEHPEARIYAQVAEQLLLSAAGVLCVSCLSQLSCDHNSDFHCIISNMHTVCSNHIQCLQTLLPLPDFIKLLTFWPEWITYNRVKQFIHFNVAEKRHIVDQFRLFFVIAAYDSASHSITPYFQSPEHAPLECSLHVSWLSLVLDVSQSSTPSLASSNNNNNNYNNNNNNNNNKDDNNQANDKIEDKESWKVPLPEHSCCVALLKTLCRDVFRYKNKSVAEEQRDTARHSAWVTLLNQMNCVTDRDSFSTYWSLSDIIVECVSRYGLLDVSWMLLGTVSQQDNVSLLVSRIMEETHRDTSVMTCVAQLYASVSQDWFSVVSSFAETLCDTPLEASVCPDATEEDFEEVFAVHEEVTERICRLCRSVSQLCLATHRSHVLFLSPSQMTLLQSLKSKKNSELKKKTQSRHTTHAMLLQFGVVEVLCDTLRHQCETHPGVATQIMDITTHMMSLDRFVSRVCRGLFTSVCHKLCRHIETASDSVKRRIAVSRARDVALCVAGVSRKLLCDTQPAVEVCHDLHQLQQSLCAHGDSVCVTDSVCRDTLLNVQSYFSECLLPVLTYVSRYFNIHSSRHPVSQGFSEEEGGVSYCVTNEFRSSVRDTWRHICRVTPNISYALHGAWFADETHMRHQRGCLSVATQLLLPATVSSVCLSHIINNNNVNNNNANNVNVNTDNVIHNTHICNFNFNVNFNNDSDTEAKFKYGYTDEESWLHSLSVTAKIVVDFVAKQPTDNDVYVAVSRPLMSVLLSTATAVTHSDCVATQLTEHLLAYLSSAMQRRDKGRAGTRVAVTLLSELLLCRDKQGVSRDLYEMYQSQVCRTTALLCLAMKLYRETPLCEGERVDSVAYVSQEELPFRLKQDNIAAVTLQRSVLTLFLGLFHNNAGTIDVERDTQSTAATQESILLSLIADSHCATSETHMLSVLYDIVSRRSVMNVTDVRHILCLALAATVSQASRDFILFYDKCVADNVNINNNESVKNTSLLSLPSAGICVAMFLRTIFFNFDNRNVCVSGEYAYVQCVLMASLCHATHQLTQHMTHWSGVAAEGTFDSVPGVSQLLRHTVSVAPNLDVSRVQDHILTVSQRLILRHVSRDTVTETHDIISSANNATQLCLGLLCHSMDNFNFVATTDFTMCVAEAVSQICHHTLTQIGVAASHCSLSGVSREYLLSYCCDTLLSVCDTLCVSVSVSRKCLNANDTHDCVAAVSRVSTTLLHTLSLLCQLVNSMCHDDTLCVSLSATQAVSQLFPHYLALHWHLFEKEVVTTSQEGCEEVFEGVLSPVSRHIVNLLVSIQRDASNVVADVSQPAIDYILCHRRGAVSRWLNATRLSTSHTSSERKHNDTVSRRVTLSATLSLWTQTLGLYLRYSSGSSATSVGNKMKPPSITLLTQIVDSLTQFIQNGFLFCQDTAAIATQATDMKNNLCRSVSYLCQLVFLCVVTQSSSYSGFVGDLVTEGLCVLGHNSPCRDNTVINETVLTRDLVTVQRLQKQPCVCSTTPYLTNDIVETQNVSGVVDKILRCLVFLMRDHNNDNNDTDTVHKKQGGAITSASVEATTATLGLLILCLGCDTVCRGLLTHWLTFEMGGNVYLRDTAEEPVATQCLTQLHSALVTGDWKKATHCVKRLFSAT